MTRQKNPEDRTAIEVERTVICNRLIREVCMHEIRLGKLTGNHYAATCTTKEIRETIHRLYGEPQ